MEPISSQINLSPRISPTDYRYIDTAFPILVTSTGTSRFFIADRSYYIKEIVMVYSSTSGTPSLIIYRSTGSSSVFRSFSTGMNDTPQYYTTLVTDTGRYLDRGDSLFINSSGATAFTMTCVLLPV